jgi:putative effector of murein hydrolase
MITTSILLHDGLWVGLTLAAFGCFRFIYRPLKQPLLHPVLWSTLFLVLLVAITHHPLSAYEQETAPLVWPCRCGKGAR